MHDSRTPRRALWPARHSVCPRKSIWPWRPSFYQTQYEHARRLIIMPYETFRLLARRLPPVRHLIMTFMTGRCGSTLLSHLFNTLDGMLSLSETDVATQFVHLRRADGSRDAELRDLLDCTVRVLFKPGAVKPPSTYALKLRGEGTMVMDLYDATFPEAKNLYPVPRRGRLGRNRFTAFSNVAAPGTVPLDAIAGLSEMLAFDVGHLASYLDAGSTEVSISQYLTLWWLAVMEAYLAQHKRGIPVLAVRYADLNLHRARVVAEVFRYCGLPDAGVEQALGVFARDAQAGTWLSAGELGAGKRAQAKRSAARRADPHPGVPPGYYNLRFHCAGYAQRLEQFAYRLIQKDTKNS